MTIIERALQKHRLSSQAQGAGKRVRTPQGPALDPARRVPRTAATVDGRLCREKRVLISSETDEDERYAAAYRMLRTRLLHRARTSNWTTIAVTSAGTNDGKTLTVINLALSLAREKSREIILLDMDMRNPSVCRALNVQPALELRDYLEHGDDVRDLFFCVGSDNLLIAGGNTPTDRASELLASSKFEDLIQVIKRGTVDPIVLIDLPPVLVTDDALVVAPKVDAVLLVTSAGLTGRAELAKALDLLSEFPMAGVVLNRASEATPAYSYAYESDASRGVKRSKA